MPPSTETPRQIGRYEIVGALGKGAMGQLYKAVEPSSNRIVAIKVLPKEFLKDEVRLERFHREAVDVTAKPVDRFAIIVHRVSPLLHHRVEFHGLLAAQSENSGRSPQRRKLYIDFRVVDYRVAGEAVIPAKK